MFRSTETFDKDRIDQRVRDVFKHEAQWTWMHRLFDCAVPLSVRKVGSMPFLVEIANGSMGSRHLFEAAFQVRLQRGAQADQLLAAGHLA